MILVGRPSYTGHTNPPVLCATNENQLNYFKTTVTLHVICRNIERQHTPAYGLRSLKQPV